MEVKDALAYITKPIVYTGHVQSMRNRQYNLLAVRISKPNNKHKFTAELTGYAGSSAVYHVDVKDIEPYNGPAAALQEPTRVAPPERPEALLDQPGSDCPRIPGNECGRCEYLLQDSDLFGRRITYACRAESM